MTGLLVVAARWAPAHRAARAYRPRHRLGAVARPARLPLALWSAQLAGGTS